MVQRHSARLTLGLAVLCMLATGMASARKLAQSTPTTTEEAVAYATQQCGVAPGSLKTLEEELVADALLKECGGTAAITDALCGLCTCTYAAGLAEFSKPAMAFNKVDTFEKLSENCRAGLLLTTLLSSGVPSARVVALADTCKWRAADTTPLATVVTECEKAVAAASG